MLVASASVPEPDGGNGGAGEDSRDRDSDTIQVFIPNATVPINSGKLYASAIHRRERVTIDLPDDVVSKIINVVTDTIVFCLDGFEGVTTVVMPRTAIRSFADAGLGVKIELQSGVLYIDESTLQSIGQQARATNVTISLASIMLDNTVQGSYAYRVSISSGVNMVEIDSPIRISLHYNGETPVMVWFLCEDGELTRLNAIFDYELGVIVFETSILGTFIIGGENATSGEVQEVPLLRFTIGEINHVYRGVLVQGDAAPFIDRSYNRAMIPLRLIAESLGANVYWDGVSRTAYITRDDMVINLPVDYSLPNSMGMPVIVSGRVFVPVRYVSEILGVNVRWDEVNRAVYVYN